MSVDPIVIVVVNIIEYIAATSIQTSVRFITYLIVPQMLLCARAVFCAGVCVVLIRESFFFAQPATE